jgi:hypothetical protein
MTDITCKQVYDKSPDEVIGAQIDFRGLLRQGEVLTGTPTMTATGITTASPLVSTGPLIINGEMVEAGKAVTVTISAGSAGTNYMILAKCGTSASQTRECGIRVKVATPTYAAP